MMYEQELRYWRLMLAKTEPNSEKGKVLKESIDLLKKLINGEAVEVSSDIKQTYLDEINRLEKSFENFIARFPEKIKEKKRFQERINVYKDIIEGEPASVNEQTIPILEKQLESEVLFERDEKERKAIDAHKEFLEEQIAKRRNISRI